MKCSKCKFEGEAEVGKFGKDSLPFRCPKCKSTKLEHYDTIDEIRRALLFPRVCWGVERKHPDFPSKQVVEFITGGADKTTVGYSIHCPVCSWGSGSCITKKEYEKLLKEQKMLIVKDADIELRKLGIR